MSAKQEHRKRLNLKLAYLRELEKWLAEEPPRFRFIAWHKWHKRRPTIKI